MNEKEARDSYWGLVWKDFCRHRLAIFSILVVLFVSIVSVFCPLIANNKPLYIHAPFQADFDNDLAVAMEAVSSGRENLSAEELENLSDGLRRMESHLQGEDLTKLRRIKEAFASGQQQENDKLLDDIDSLFDATIVPITRFPAFRTLTRLEITLMIYTVLLLPFYFFKDLGISFQLIAPLSVAVFMAFLIRAVFTPVTDNQDYKQLVSSQRFVEASGEVVYPLIPYGENENIITDTREAPSWLLPEEDRPAPGYWHWLGTDTNGRDVLARMVYGSRVSMVVGIVAVAIYTIIGIILGAVAGYFQGWTDILLSRIIEIVICFPPIMVILAVQAYLRPSLINLILALALLWWTGVARLQRAEFLKLANMEYVQAIRGLGGSTLRIIFLHILPNGLGPVLVLVSFGIAGSILIESALSFLGFGVPQPMASWGDLLNNGRNDIRGTWWLTVFPGLAIFITVTCFNLMGEALRDALDPRKSD